MATIENEKRFLAEWEPQEAILMALPEAHTDWSYILDRARNQYLRLVEAFTGHGIHVVMLCTDQAGAQKLFAEIPENLLTLVEAQYNDTWTRDYGPLCLEKHGDLRLLDFGFNGWGLKFAADRDNLVNLFLRDRHIMNPDLYRNNRDFELEGGSIDSDGKGTVLTTSRCLCSPNRNGGKSKKELNTLLHDRLGAEHVLWLDHGALEGDDTDSHIDTLARLAPGNAIVFTGCRNMDDPQFEGLLAMRAQLTLFRNAQGEPYNLVELPLPDPIYDDEGQRLPATYANYLVSNNVVFMPTYGQEHNDFLAAQTLKIVFPDHEVTGVDCTTLLWQHGSLHCATMQIHTGCFNSTIFD